MHNRRDIKNLTPETVLAIREKAASGVTDPELAAQYGISPGRVQLVRTGVRYADLGGPRTFYRPGPKRGIFLGDARVS